MEPIITIKISAQGVQSIEIQADSERDQAYAELIINQIRPCLDVADAILKKTNVGPRG